MGYSTWAAGFVEASNATNYAVKLEHELAHTALNLKDRIFPAYLKAAELWSNLLASGLSPPSRTFVEPISFLATSSKQDSDIGDKAEAKKRWRTCLERGKLVKSRFQALGIEVSKVGQDVVGQEPVSRAGLAPRTEYQSFLRQSSSVNGSSLPLWNDTKVPGWSETILPEAGPSKRYGRRPRLNQDQQAYRPAWKSNRTPFQAIRIPSVPSPEHAETVKVEQGMGANCSVVVGLEQCLKHNLKWGRRLVQENLEPISVPQSFVESSSLWYKQKIFVNGSWRAVVIDDTLPRAESADFHMCAEVVRDLPTTGDPELDAEAEDQPVTPLQQQVIDEANGWLPLAEKAYMTLHAGYDFPGSIPSVDLYSLTSWIPERLQFTSPEFKRERSWRRIAEGLEHGKCLAALGTGWNVRGMTGLVPLHAYGISKVWEDSEGRRRVRVDNPWKRTRSGEIIGTTSITEWTKDLRNTLVEEESVPHSLTFSWDEVCNRFDTLELNWNPEIFANTREAHSQFDAQTKTSQPPSYQLNVDSQLPGAEVWLLLLRHLVNDEASLKEKPSIALQVSEDDEGTQQQPWKIYESAQVNFLDGPLVLIKHECLRERSVLKIAPVIEAPIGSSVKYSIFAYSDANLEFRPVAKTLPYEVSVDGDFTDRSAGGSHLNPTYIDNPQYKIEISAVPYKGSGQTAIVRLNLSSNHASMPLGIEMARSDGKRVTESVAEMLRMAHPLAKFAVDTQRREARNILAGSDGYRRGTTQIEIEKVSTGSYTLVLSSFDPGRKGSYGLTVESTLPVTLSPIPQEGAGMHQRVLKAAWFESNAAGRPSAGNYESNPTFELMVGRSATIFARLQLEKASDIPVNLTLFRRESGGTLGKQVASSGPYSDQTSGVVVPMTQLEPGIYMVVASTYSPGILASFKLRFYATGPIDLTSV